MEIKKEERLLASETKIEEKYYSTKIIRLFIKLRTRGERNEWDERFWYRFYSSFLSFNRILIFNSDPLDLIWTSFHGLLRKWRKRNVFSRIRRSLHDTISKKNKYIFIINWERMFPTKEGITIKIRNLIFLSGYNTFILIPFKSLPLVNRLSTLNPSIYSRNLTTIHLGSIGSWRK